ncbi:hypothetical protein mvi_62530 (plasmid) [Methylobacterium indicum]|uniref:Uncharacterized protein n=2 Tax=Methylobacterium indicum TaxID=1775910 RepID=A0A8H8X1F6_9HYPH|nr:hypothetical protein mvi_62530 [Methylobacterium indicum]
MSDILLLHLPKVNTDLDAMLKKAAQHVMSPAERHAQARSWVIGQMMLSHPEMSRAEAEAHADRAVGPNLAARVAELEAENARLNESARLLVEKATTMMRVFNEIVQERDELKVALAVCEGRSACQGMRELPIVPRFPN